ncbi:MAG TPA: serine protease [Thermoanaerobaculia bacterium]|nr:serine protease [Thermoanaerobaculia bacterium]
MVEQIQALLNAAEEYDRLSSEEAAQQLVEHVRESGETLDETALLKALTALRDNRWFDLLLTTADGIQQAGDARSFVRRLYAQALIDSGAIMAAIPFLRTLIAETPAGRERTDARGILGRAWKQAYVNGNRGKELLENAVTAYYEPYAEDAGSHYHGINAVACLSRAQCDGVQLSGNFPDWRELACTIRMDIDGVDDPASWQYATAMEASFALNDRPAAERSLKQYLQHPRTSAFAIAATRRQLLDVWCVSPEDPVIHILQAALLMKDGGESIELPARSKGLEAILGEEQYKPLEWYQRGLTRARAVARIGRLATQGFGTGFLVNARDLDPSRGGQLLITNHHVLPGGIRNHREAVVTFEALDGGAKKYAVAEVLWTSPVEDLDATVMRLSDNVDGIELYPICTPPLPALDSKPKPRLYVIGHPLGGTMQFSISDNLMIDHEDPKVHYRTPTAGGSSGSPVFDDDWKLLALHHAGQVGRMLKLHGKGMYSANEGLYFPTIVRRFQARAK